MVIREAIKVYISGRNESSSHAEPDLLRSLTQSSLGTKALLIWRFVEGLKYHLGSPRADSHLTARQLPSDAFRVVVVGAGPAGLLAALEAYKSGASVHVIEKRIRYTR